MLHLDCGLTKFPARILPVKSGPVRLSGALLLTMAAILDDMDLDCLSLKSEKTQVHHHSLASL